MSYVLGSVVILNSLVILKLLRRGVPHIFAHCHFEVKDGVPLEVSKHMEVRRAWVEDE